MAANGPDDKGKKGDQGKEPPAWNMDAIPEAMREAGRRASELAQNPYARSLFAAGLVAATAALAANKNVREATRKNLREATDAAGVAAENAGKIGAAIIEAATDAVQRMLSLGADMAGAAVPGGGQTEASAPAPAAPQPARTPPKRKAPAKAADAAPKARKPRAPSGGSASKAASSPAARKAPAKKPTGKSEGDKPAPKRGTKKGN